MFIPDPNFYPSPIPDLESRIQKQQQKRGAKKICCPTFFVPTNITKLKIIVFFNWQRKKIRANLQTTIELFTQKIDIRLSKM
jgi:hypothetical protein